MGVYMVMTTSKTARSMALSVLGFGNRSPSFNYRKSSTLTQGAFSILAKTPRKTIRFYF